MAAIFYVRQKSDGIGVQLMVREEGGNETITVLTAVGPLSVMKGMLQRTADALNEVLDNYQAGKFAGREVSK